MSDELATSPTTRLGDWGANLVYVGRQQLVLAVSERTFLPVVVTAAPINALVERLRARAGEVLDAVGIDSLDIDRELAEMATVSFGKTASRQVTGILVDFAKGLEIYLEVESSLLSCSLKLAETPCSPLRKTAISPDRATRLMFSTSGSGRVE